VQRLVLLNQMAGPLFIDLVEGLFPFFPNGCLLYTAHPDAIEKFSKGFPKVELVCSSTYDRSTFRSRIISWLKYVLGATRFILFPKFGDAFLLSTNPPILGFWFWLISRIRNSPYILCVYDLYPEVLVQSGILRKENPIAKIWEFLNAKAYGDAQSVITIGRGLAEEISQTHKGIGSKLKIIYPWADTDVYKPIPLKRNQLRKRFNPEGKKVILYAGNMGGSHDIESMVLAADLLKDRNDLFFIFVGGGGKWNYVSNYREQHSLKNVGLHPYLALSQLPDLLALATVSLVGLEVGKQQLMLPSKLFYYLASGSPVVALSSGSNDVQDIILGNDCGVCLQPGDPANLARELEELISDHDRLSTLRINARSAAVSKFSKSIRVAEFKDIFGCSGWI
jgi:glycosyltransferase involved in cell wall biosynthesis